ncbi:hypothetical protein GCM10025777_40540 [Membranihabitans marinus]|uniref:Secreted protein n=1 Tax=Nesterenkonia rhizosphaerae TaxID=1348272 RepID=A0ABP9G7X0_9MICC
MEVLAVLLLQTLSGRLDVCELDIGSNPAFSSIQGLHGRSGILTSFGGARKDRLVLCRSRAYAESSQG